MAASAQAAVTIGTNTAANFPSSAAFQTFDPHVTPDTAERTVNTTRNISQTFQLGSDLTVGEIDLMIARGISGSVGQLQIFSVADTLASDITADYNSAVANGFLLDFQFAMPEGLDPASGALTLQFFLSGGDAVTLPATAGSAGYALNLSVPDDTSNVLTWRFGDPGSGGPADGFYPDGRVYYDAFMSSGATQTRRDALFALVAVPEPTSLALLGLGTLMAIFRLRRR